MTVIHPDAPPVGLTVSTPARAALPILTLDESIPCALCPCADGVCAVDDCPGAGGWGDTAALGGMGHSGAHLCVCERLLLVVGTPSLPVLLWCVAV